MRVKNPIEQDMVGTAGLYRVQNIEKRRLMSVREWYELCARDELRTPGVYDGDRRARGAPPAPRTSRGRRGKNAAAATGYFKPEMNVPVRIIGRASRVFWCAPGRRTSHHRDQHSVSHEAYVVRS